MAPPRLYYVRHGLTDWNIAGKLQGRRDTPLNDRGRKQAHACAHILKDLFARDGLEPADLVYVSSPLMRATETMDIMRAELALPPGGYTCDERLAEISFGDWEGLTYLDVIARDKEVVDRRESGKWLFRSPGGETYAEVAQRVGEWYATLDRDTVVTAHGGTCRALVGYLGVEEEESAAHQPVEQGCVYLFADRAMTRYA